MLTLPQGALVIFLLTGVTAYSGLREELQEATAVWAEAIGQQDVEKASLAYTEDCTVMIVGHDEVHGREGVKDLIKSFLDFGMAKLTFVMEEVGPSDATDTAYDRSSQTIFDKDGNIMARGTQVIVWKKVEGKWLAHNVMVNYDFKSEDLSQMDDDTLKAELEVLHEAFSAAAKAQDFATMVSFFTEDAVFIFPGHHTIKGKQAIRGAIEVVCGKEPKESRFWPEEVGYLGLSKDMAYDKGHYTWMQKVGETADEGKYVILWKRVEGQWKINVNIWSSNTPPEKPRDEL